MVRIVGRDERCEDRDGDEQQNDYEAGHRGFIFSEAFKAVFIIARIFYVAVYNPVGKALLFIKKRKKRFHHDSPLP